MKYRKHIGVLCLVGILLSICVPAFAASTQEDDAHNMHRPPADVLDLDMFEEMPGVTVSKFESGAVLFTTNLSPEMTEYFEEELDRQLSVLPQVDEDEAVVFGSDDKQISKTFRHYFAASNGQRIGLLVTVTGDYSLVNRIAKVTDVSYSISSFIPPGSDIDFNVGKNANKGYFYIYDNGKSYTITYILGINGGFEVEYSDDEAIS